MIESLAHSPFIEQLLAQTRDMNERLYALFVHPILGNAENARHVSRDSFVRAVTELNERRLRLQLLMPAFPFKDQNPYRTAAAADHVDLGEVALLIRLHTQVLAVYQVHPYGADWVIVSDGSAFAPFFYIEEAKADAYARRLRRFRDSLNLQGTVSILDLKDLTRRLVSANHGTDVFQSTAGHIEKWLRERVIRDGGAPAEHFQTLVRGMKWNVNSRSWADRYGWERFWPVLNEPAPDSVPADMRSAWTEIHSLTTDTAFQYAAFNLALRYHDAFGKLLPTMIRATVHPKKGQLAAPWVGREHERPWNGVPLVTTDRSVQEVETTTLLRLARKHNKLIAFCEDGASGPFYYSVPDVLT